MDYIVYALAKKHVANREAVITELIENNQQQALESIQQEKERAESEERRLEQFTTDSITAHDLSDECHQNLRDLIADLDARLRFVANSTDIDLDQLAELVAFIKANRESILTIFADKVDIAAIVDNLITEVADQPLSANQGVQLRLMIEALDLSTTQRLTELDEVLNQKISDLSASTDSRINTLENSTNAKIDALESSTNAKLNDLNTSTENRIDALENSTNTKINDLNADLLARMESHQIESDNKITSLENATNTKITSLENTTNERIDDLNADLLAKMEAHQAESDAKNQAQDTAFVNHLKDINNPHKVTKQQLGLSNVENKNSETIREELTKENVTNALGYTPLTPAEVTTQISTEINNLHATIAATNPFIVSTSAPSNTHVFWIDPNNGLKYHNGSTWVAVPVAWT